MVEEDPARRWRTRLVVAGLWLVSLALVWLWLRATIAPQFGEVSRELAQAMGADLAYIGSAFIATEEARASEAYKQAIVEGTSDDIVYSNLFTGVHGNYLKPSIRAAGLDPDNLPESDPSKMSFGGGEGSKPKAWKEIWGSGQGIGSVEKVMPVAELVARFKSEYEAAADAPLQ